MPLNKEILDLLNDESISGKSRGRRPDNKQNHCSTGEEYECEELHLRRGFTISVQTKPVRLCQYAVLTLSRSKPIFFTHACTGEKRDLVVWLEFTQIQRRNFCVANHVIARFRIIRAILFYIRNNG